MAFTATPLDGSPTPIPMSSAVPDGTNTPLAVEGGPSKVTGGNTLAPVATYQYDGYNVVEGVTTDAAVVGDNPGTVSAKLRGLTKIFNDIWDSVNHRLHVNVDNANANGQTTMSASAPVVIASDQSPVAVKGSATGAAAPAQAFYIGMSNFSGVLQGLRSSANVGYDATDPNTLLPVAQYAAGGTGGAGITANLVRVATIYKAFNAQALTAIAGNTPVSIWTPAAGRKFRLMGYWFSTSAAAGLVFHDLASVGGGGLIPFPSPVAAAAGILQSPPIGNGFLSATINNQLWIDATAATTVTGFVWGVEE